jgi:hypothetical protein
MIIPNPAKERAMNSHETITQFPKSAIERLPFPISVEDLAKTIEVLIALTDLLEPDRDLEPDLDDEPGTWTELHQNRASCPIEGEDLEDNGDGEPSLASPETGCRSSQLVWARGGDGDAEYDVVDAPHDAEGV